MNVVPRPPQLRFARAGANPTLETLEYVQSALTAVGGPVSRNRLMTILASWGHATTRRSLNVALEFYFAIGVLEEEPEGLIWVSPSPKNPRQLIGRRPARLTISA